MPNSVVMTRYEPPEVLKWARVPLAEPGEGQIRIKVKATGISPTDLALRADYLKVVAAMIFGSSVAGIDSTVVAVAHPPDRPRPSRGLRHSVTA